MNDETTAIWWEARLFADALEPVTVTRETACYVWVTRDRWGAKSRPSRRQKDGNLFRSWDEGRAELVRRCEEGKLAALRRADELRDRSAKLQALEKPDIAG